MRNMSWCFRFPYPSTFQNAVTPKNGYRLKCVQQNTTNTAPHCPLSENLSPPSFLARGGTLGYRHLRRRWVWPSEPKSPIQIHTIVWGLGWVARCLYSVAVV